MCENIKISDNVEIKTLGDICLILSNSGRHISYGKNHGKYPFYNSSLNLDKYVDIADYNDESIIISKYGNAKIKYDVNFSCSTSVYILRSSKVLIKYIYYYLYNNLDILQNSYIGYTIPYITKNTILSIKIPIPSIEKQQSIIEACDNITNSINLLYNDIKNKKQDSKILFNFLCDNSICKSFNNDIIDYPSVNELYTILEVENQPITEPITETITEPITETITETITEPITETITEPSTEPSREKITNRQKEDYCTQQ